MKKFFCLAAWVLLISCNKESPQDWGGMEYFTFKISGVVTDNTGFPLGGICVSSFGSEIYTDSEGAYLLEGRGSGDTSVFVNYTDTDGVENGGRYMASSRRVTLEYKKGTRHGPYMGLFTATDIDVTLVAGLTPSINPDTPLQ